MVESLTGERLMEALADCDESAEGIQRFNEIVFGSRLHDGQLRFAIQADKEVNLLSPGNSWGKTEFIARESVRRCWMKTGTDASTWLTSQYNGLVAAFNYDIAEEVFTRINHLYLQGGALAALIEKIYVSKPQQVRFANGSVLDFGSLGEGGRLVEATRRHFVFVDEVGQVPDFEEVFNSVIWPRTIGVNGKVFLVGTPKPHTDTFIYEIFEVGSKGDSFYYAQEGSSFENTYWPEKERQRVLSNPKLVRPDGKFTELGKQVVNGKFRLAGGLFFNKLRIARLFTGDWGLPLLEGSDESGSIPDPSRYFLVAWDLGGRKKKSDATVGMALDITEYPWRITSFTRFEGAEAEWEEKYDAIEESFNLWKPPFVLIDVTGSTRDSISEALENRGVTVEGVHFGGAGAGRKYNMLRSLQSALEMDWVDSDGRQQRGLIRAPNTDIEPNLKQLKSEMERYILNDEKLTQDCVMTLAMLVHYAMMESLPDAVAGEAY